MFGRGLGENLENVVAELVTKGIVGVLEVIEVEDKHRYRRAAKDATLADGVCHLEQRAAVR